MFFQRFVAHLKRGLGVFVLLCGFAVPGWARDQGVILFIDFNHAPEEIAAAQRAASQRGDRLVVLPNLSPQDHAAFDQAEKEIPKLAQRIIALGTRRPANAAQYDELSARLRELRENRRRIRDHYDFTKADVAQAYQTIRQSGDRLESLILSGHSTGDSYFGDFGDLDTDDIESALSPPAGEPQTLESVYLWGCYTNTLNESLEWKRAFPSLKMILGFDGKAPSSTLPGSYELLGDALKKEARIRAARNSRELIAQFKSLRHSLITHSSIAVGSCYVSAEAPHKVLNLNSAKDCRGVVDSLLQRSQQIYEPYKAAVEGSAFENPPADPAHSPLREFYNQLQSGYHCVTLLHQEHILPEKEQVIRLIFFENMRQHFNEAYRTELEAMNHWLESLSPPTSLRYPGLPPSTASRSSLQIFSREFRTLGLRHNLPPEIESLYDLQIRNSLLSLHCMPLPWVEPLRAGERVPKPSDCGGENSTRRHR